LDEQRVRTRKQDRIVEKCASEQIFQTFVIRETRCCHTHLNLSWMCSCLVLQIFSCYQSLLMFIQILHCSRGFT